LTEKLDTFRFRTIQGLTGGQCLTSRTANEERPGKEFTVLQLVEPGALDVEELNAWNAASQSESVDRELGDRLVGRGIGLVVEDVHGAVSDLQEVDVAGDNARGIADAPHELDAVEMLERAISSSVSQMRISIATVTLSLASVNLCRVS